MDMPLLHAVEGYAAKNRARFHMPGHKGVELPLDITEVDGADSLFHPEGAIASLERELEKIYSARRTLLCAGGATLCIQTMLALACGTGGRVIISRNIHRSAVNACALLDLQPEWVYPEDDAGGWFSGRYTPQAVRAALAAYPDARAVYLTSPDYFGVVSDIAGIAAVCREYDVFLLVDNAHGAHLKFLPEGYGVRHPLDCGASACADSLHKTMPAMTGGALLHLADDRLTAGAKEMMALFGSTSPSYPILLSCERAAVYARTDAREGFARTARWFDRLRALAAAKGFGLPQGAADPAKLSLAFGAFGLEGDRFGGYLRENGIEPEYVSGTACVLMGNGLNSEGDFLRLQAALERFAPGGARVAPPQTPAAARCERALRVREAVFAPREQVPVGEAAGRVAALDATPCPPGIPLVMSGEKISEQAARALAAYRQERVWVVRRDGRTGG